MYPRRSHYDLDDVLRRVNQNENADSSRDGKEVMRPERKKRSLPSVEKERGWPSQIGTRPACSRKKFNLCDFAVVALEDARMAKIFGRHSRPLWCSA